MSIDSAGTSSVRTMMSRLGWKATRTTRLDRRMNRARQDSITTEIMEIVAFIREDAKRPLCLPGE